MHWIRHTFEGKKVFRAKSLYRVCRRKFSLEAKQASSLRNAATGGLFVLSTNYTIITNTNIHPQKFLLETLLVLYVITSLDGFFGKRERYILGLILSILAPISQNNKSIFIEHVYILYERVYVCEFECVFDRERTIFSSLHSRLCHFFSSSYIIFPTFL